MEAFETMDTDSVCCVRVAERVFAIDTRWTREVLDGIAAHRIPLAPEAIAGLIPYRGEILTIVSLRSLLGLPQARQPGCFVVLDLGEEDEPFGLAVDAIEDLRSVARGSHEPNPKTLDSRSSHLFEGVYGTPQGLIIRLDATRLTPWHALHNEE